MQQSAKRPEHRQWRAEQARHGPHPFERRQSTDSSGPSKRPVIYVRSTNGEEQGRRPGVPWKSCKLAFEKNPKAVIRKDFFPQTLVYCSTTALVVSEESNTCTVHVFGGKI